LVTTAVAKATKQVAKNAIAVHANGPLRSGGGFGSAPPIMTHVRPAMAAA